MVNAFCVYTFRLNYRCAHTGIHTHIFSWKEPIGYGITMHGMSTVMRTALRLAQGSLDALQARWCSKVRNRQPQLEEHFWLEATANQSIMVD